MIEKFKESRLWKYTFFTAVVLALCTHLPIMLSDIPNHDGLASIYFDQNMIVSGRWFLSIACGFSSYYTLPWLIGLISIVILFTLFFSYSSLNGGLFISSSRFFGRTGVNTSKIC